MIYWDHNATTPLRASVKKRMKEAIDSYHGNPNSIHAMGQETRGLIEEVRSHLAQNFSCRTSEIIFTGSATEANFLGLWNLWLTRTAENPERRKILASPLEHSSIHENLLFLKDKMNAEIVFLPLTTAGLIDLEKLRTLTASSDFAFCTTMAAHNETGIIQPWKEIAEICFEKKIPFHSDLVQITGRLPFGFKDSKLTTATIAFHKMGGPKGLGVLLTREGTKFEPIMRGGGQEKQRRPGTENILAIAGLGAWLHEFDQMIEGFKNIESIRNGFETEILKTWPTAQIVGQNIPRIPNTSYIIFEGIKSDALLMALSYGGVCASSGAACSSGIVKPSRALLQMGFSELKSQSAIRFSLGLDSTSEEARCVAACLNESLKRFAA